MLAFNEIDNCARENKMCVLVHRDQNGTLRSRGITIQSMKKKQSHIIINVWHKKFMEKESDLQKAETEEHQDTLCANNGIHIINLI